MHTKGWICVNLPLNLKHRNWNSHPHTVQVVLAALQVFHRAPGLFANFPRLFSHRLLEVECLPSKNFHLTALGYRICTFQLTMIWGNAKVHWYTNLKDNTWTQHPRGPFCSKKCSEQRTVCSYEIMQKCRSPIFTGTARWNLKKRRFSPESTSTHLDPTDLNKITRFYLWGVVT